MIPTFEEIVGEVCAVHGLAPHDILQPRATGARAEGRRDVIWLGIKLAGWSYTECGWRLGMSAVAAGKGFERHARYRDSNPTIAARLALLSKRLAEAAAARPAALVVPPPPAAARRDGAQMRRALEALARIEKRIEAIEKSLAELRVNRAGGGGQAPASKRQPAPVAMETAPTRLETPRPAPPLDRRASDRPRAVLGELPPRSQPAPVAPDGEGLRLAREMRRLAPREPEPPAGALTAERAIGVLRRRGFAVWPIEHGRYSVEGVVLSEAEMIGKAERRAVIDRIAV